MVKGYIKGKTWSYKYLKESFFFFYKKIVRFLVRIPQWNGSLSDPSLENNKIFYDFLNQKMQILILVYIATFLCNAFVFLKCIPWNANGDLIRNKKNDDRTSEFFVVIYQYQGVFPRWNLPKKNKKLDNWTMIIFVVFMYNFFTWIIIMYVIHTQCLI